MAAKYILAALSIGFLALGIACLARDRRQLAPAARTWLLVGVIFAVVSGLLFVPRA